MTGSIKYHDIQDRILPSCIVFALKMQDRICQKCHKNVKINPTSSDHSHLDRTPIYIKHHDAQGGVSLTNAHCCKNTNHFTDSTCKEKKKVITRCPKFKKKKKK